MNNALVSVIIPIYNTEKYLKKCLESVLNQTYTNLEIWLIDDGSTDISGAICDEFARLDARIIVIHKENAGQGIARNVALDKCTGEYIAFVDSDDWIETTFIEKLVLEIEKAEADICISGYYAHSGIRIARVKHPRCVLNSTRDIIHCLVSTNNISTISWDKLYRRALFNSIRYPGVRANEDAYLIYDLLQLSTKIVMIEDCLYHQLLRPGSTERSNFSEKNYALIGAAEKLMKIVKNNYTDLYSNVQFNAAEAICSLMYKIVYSGKGAENEKHYAIMNEFLNKELERIQSTEKVSDPKKFKALKMIALQTRRAKRIFKRRARIARVKSRIKIFIQKLKKQ